MAQTYAHALKSTKPQSTGRAANLLAVPVRSPLRRSNGERTAKLVVGRPDDAFEQQAGRAAGEVMREPAGGSAARLASQRHTEGADEGAAPPSVQQTLARPGQPLDGATRSFMEPRFRFDFSRVRVYSDQQAAQSAREVNANAYTVGQKIVFGAGQYAPETSEGQRLLAHELTHVVQQSGGSGMEGRVAPLTLQRELTEAQLPSTPDTTIRQDPTYIDNGIRRIEFYSAELAIIHYEDGAQFRLGLVPGEIQPPVEGVDYRTLRSAHVLLDPEGTGRTRFLPRGTQIRAPGMSGGEVIQQFSRTITYRLDTASRRITPTEVNDITAPNLCTILRQAEAEYVRNMDEMARGMVRALRVMEVALIIALIIPTGGESAVAAGTRGAAGAGAAEAAAAGRAVGALRSLFLRALRSGAAESITVEGVGLGGVRAVMGEGRALTVFYSHIINTGRVAGQGRFIHTAFEQAAVAAARETGAASVRVAVQLVVNPKWKVYLESLGYASDVLPTATGYTWAMVRTLAL